MQKKFSTGKILRFLREAKALKVKLSISHSAALDTIARREGYPDWATLKRNASKSVPLAHEAPEQPVPSFLTLERFLDVCFEFIETLDDEDVYCLAWSGSLWINIQSARCGQVDADDLLALGRVMDGLTREAGWRAEAILAINFEGLAERFVLEDDVDDDGQPVVPEEGVTVMYSTDAAREELLSSLDATFERDYERLVEGLRRHLEAANRPSQDSSYEWD